MLQNLNLEDIHEKLLDIARLFHEICQKNNIPYYMLNGTMLGAFRHKGFIPWDDDMDFGVMEENFPRLIDALKEGLPPYLKIRDIYNCESISTFAIKIEDERYEVVELEKENIKEKMGLFIDVFPLSRTHPEKGFLSRNWLCEFLLRVNWARFLNYKSRGVFKNAVSQIIKIVLYPFPRGFLPNFVNRFIIPHEGVCITNYWGAWINKELVPAETMGTPQLYPFEKESFWGVENVDDYLTHLYGDYMRLPKENEIHYHLIGVKRVK